MLPNKTMSIDINKVNFYPPLIQDYLNGSLLKNGIVNWEYSKCELRSKIENRSFSSDSRKLLVERLRIQNSGFVLTSQEEDSLIALENELNIFSKTWNWSFVKLSFSLLSLAAKCEQILCIFSFGYFCKSATSLSTSQEPNP